MVYIMISKNIYKSDVNIQTQDSIPVATCSRFRVHRLYCRIYLVNRSSQKCLFLMLLHCLVLILSGATRCSIVCLIFQAFDRSRRFGKSAKSSENVLAQSELCSNKEVLPNLNDRLGSGLCNRLTHVFS